MNRFGYYAVTQDHIEEQTKLQMLNSQKSAQGEAVNKVFVANLRY